MSSVRAISGEETHTHTHTHKVSTEMDMTLLSSFALVMERK
jgi:hypothetical protein